MAPFMAMSVNPNDNTDLPIDPGKSVQYVHHTEDNTNDSINNSNDSADLPIDSGKSAQYVHTLRHELDRIVKLIAQQIKTGDANEEQEKNIHNSNDNIIMESSSSSRSSARKKLGREWELSYRYNTHNRKNRNDVIIKRPNKEHTNNDRENKMNDSSSSSSSSSADNEDEGRTVKDEHDKNNSSSISNNKDYKQMYHVIVQQMIELKSIMAKKDAELQICKKAKNHSGNLNHNRLNRSESKHNNTKSMAYNNNKHKNYHHGEIKNRKNSNEDVTRMEMITASKKVEEGLLNAAEKAACCKKCRNSNQCLYLCDCCDKRRDSRQCFYLCVCLS